MYNYSFNDDNSATICHVDKCANDTERIPNCAEFSFDIKNPNLSAQQKQKCQFLNTNSDVFSNSLSDIGKTDLHMHKTETIPGAKPVHQRFYRQDPVKKAETDKQTNEMLEANLIEKSSSVWNSPVVLVKRETVLGGLQWITGN